MPVREVTVFTENDARFHTHPDPFLPDETASYVVLREESPISGVFDITADLWPDLELLTPEARARLATIALNAMMNGNSLRAITADLLQEAKTRNSLGMLERAERLLHRVYDQTRIAGQELEYVDGDTHLLLYSESTDWDEVPFLLNYLEAAGLITVTGTYGHCKVVLTVDGFEHIAGSRRAVDSDMAFVAMWFDDSTNDLFECGIRPAIEHAGYRPRRIDQVATLNKIDDQIIAEIKRSRFLVADFTHGDEGVRGSVYYEAGFAHGLGIPVIFTGDKQQTNKLQFDTRQYPHILWSDHTELRSELANRIEALLDKGPLT
ncbi:hypothetical protein [Candidatus Poriferisodalis sp.]|uniref:hypothetical protein n=1 Tax=Candidatus Poriferisodalis sp. TaxID=3101277 RepID=UPI003B0164B1